MDAARSQIVFGIHYDLFSLIEKHIVLVFPRCVDRVDLRSGDVKHVRDVHGRIGEGRGGTRFNVSYLS
jgi:hypothetical protein